MTEWFSLIRYYVATVAGDPGARHVYTVTDVEAPPERRRQHSCLTCDWSPGCLYNEAKISPNGKYMVMECLGPGTPRTELRHLNNTLIEVLNTNSLMQEREAMKVTPRVKEMRVPLPGAGFAHMQLLLPDSLSETETTHHHPIVIEL